MEENKVIDFNSMLYRYLYFEYVFSLMRNSKNGHGVQRR